MVPGTGGSDVRVTGVSGDSRSVVPGDLYAAIPGARHHGADFTTSAVEAGAVAVLTDPAGLEPSLAAGVPVVVVPDPRAVLGSVAAAVQGHPDRRMLVLGVTGTNGKTTTTYLLDAGLRAAGHRTGLVGTVETRVGEAVVPSVRTTPEAPDVQRLLARMVEDGCTAVSMEVSSHALALGRVDGTDLRRRAVHQPQPGPPRLPPDARGLLRRQGRAVHPRPLAARCGRRRHRLGTAARRRGHDPGDHGLLRSRARRARRRRRTGGRRSRLAGVRRGPRPGRLHLPGGRPQR